MRDGGWPDAGPAITQIKQGLEAAALLRHAKCLDPAAFFGHAYFHPHVRVRTHTRAMTAIFPPSCVLAHMQAIRLESLLCRHARTRDTCRPGPCFSSSVEPCGYVGRFAASPSTRRSRGGPRIPLGAACSSGAGPARRQPTARADGSRHSSCGARAGQGAQRCPSVRSLFVPLVRLAM